MKRIFIVAVMLLFSASPLLAQNQVTFSPEKPQAGESVTVTFIPAKDLSKSKVEVVTYVMGPGNQDLNSLTLIKKGTNYEGTFNTGKEDNFVAVGIKIDGLFDANEGNGYITELYNGEDVKPGFDLSAAKFYSGSSRYVGIDASNPEKAIGYYETAFEDNKEEKAKNIISFTQVQVQKDKAQADKIYQSSIEWILKNGLEKESDYSNLETLYRLAKLPAQMNFITKIKKEKFPDGDWALIDMVNKFLAEKDLSKKEQLLQEFSAKLERAGNPENLDGAKNYMINNLLGEYGKNKDYAKLEEGFTKNNITGQLKAQTLNSLAWSMQEKDEDLNQALKFAREATQIAKAEIANPSDKKPYYITNEDWLKSRKRTYASFADTYGMVQYKLGNYKAGFPFAKEAAIDITGGKDAGLNKTYVLLAEKVLSPKKLQPQIAGFIADGVADADMVAVMQRLYENSKPKKSWDVYYKELQAKANEKAMEELVKTMISNASPKFALFDAKGQKVNIDELKNKVVIVDFWATWCGPCKASFPGMQKMIQKYKNDNDVVFLFVNSWESIEDQKEKEDAVNKFIADNKYDFRVLFDNDNKVIESFGVDGIPTKFVIDKKGNIRFKSVGFGGSDEKLVTELTGMIELARKG